MSKPFIETGDNKWDGSIYQMDLSGTFFVVPFFVASQDIPESRRQPILAGMSAEERVSAPQRALLFESRLNNSSHRCRTARRAKITIRRKDD